MKADSKVKVIVQGADEKLGQEVIRAIMKHPHLQLIPLSLTAQEIAGKNVIIDGVSIQLFNQEDMYSCINSSFLQIFLKEEEQAKPETIPDIIIDLTPCNIEDNISFYLMMHIPFVLGVTPDDDMNYITNRAGDAGIGAVIVPMTKEKTFEDVSLDETLYMIACLYNLCNNPLSCSNLFSAGKVDFKDGFSEN